MTCQIIFRPEAEFDVEQAYDWFQSQKSGLGANFILQLDNSLNLIRENPKIYPIIHKNIRRTLIHRFPYGIYFFIKDNRIIVIGILHAKRNPETWQSRV